MDADTCLRANTLCDFGARLRHPHLGELLFPLRLPGNSIRRAACNQRLEVGDALECLILPIFRNQGANSAQAQQHLCKIPQRSARREFLLRNRESNACCQSEQVGACAHCADLRLKIKRSSRLKGIAEIGHESLGNLRPLHCSVHEHARRFGPRVPCELAERKQRSSHKLLAARKRNPLRKDGSLVEKPAYKSLPELGDPVEKVTLHLGQEFELAALVLVLVFMWELAIPNTVRERLLLVDVHCQAIPSP